MKKKLKTGLTVSLSIVTICFLLLTIYRWSWYYNEKGVYFDEETITTYDDDAILAFGMLTILSIIQTMILLSGFRKASDKRKI